MISFHFIVAISFDLINPFVTTSFSTLLKFNKFLCLVPIQGLHFILFYFFALLLSIEKHMDYLKPLDRFMALLLQFEDNMHHGLP